MIARSPIVRPVARHEPFVAAAMLITALLYLVPFVSRGWIPHDEGMIGQAAERVLAGDMPHVDYEEAYTGGLTWLYAVVFAATDVDLVNLRWLLFVAVSVAMWCLYSILRRFLAPMGAAIASWVALAWSFPNYFAGLPSWWVLICAIVCMWGFIRHAETGRLRYVAAAGLAAGVAIVIKQTGIYLLVALSMSLVFGSGPSKRDATSSRPLDALVRYGLGVGAFLFAVFLLRSRIHAAELLYLLCPIAATSIALQSRQESGTQGLASVITVVCAAATCAAFAVAGLLAPYVIAGHIGDFISGAIVLPQRRLTFASKPMPSAELAVTGIGMAAIMIPLVQRGNVSAVRLPELFRWMLAVVLPVVSLWNYLVYQFIWQSSRAIGAFLPLVVAWLLLSDRVTDATARRVLFASGSLLAWASLVQFPFSAPIYFCYTAPLAVIAAVAAASAAGWMRRSVIGPWVLLLLTFATLSMHRGYIQNLGVSHEPQKLNVPLALPRAHLAVSAEDAGAYRRVEALVQRHLQSGELLAGPDAPEIYFLTGRFNRSGSLFDFFSGETSDMLHGSTGGSNTNSVLVLNHEPAFSDPPSAGLISEARRQWPAGEQVGRFEVRWR